MDATKLSPKKRTKKKFIKVDEEGHYDLDGVSFDGSVLTVAGSKELSKAKGNANDCLDESFWEAKVLDN